MTAKLIYRDLCEREKALPLFHQSWWLDAVCGAEGWDVAIVRKGHEVQATLPYAIVKSKGFTYLGQPALTPFLGPWIRPTGAKKANDYARQKDLMEELINGLPKHDRYRQNWSPEVTNWLPFYWRGFQQTTAYTYVINDLSDEGAIWREFRENIRREIRRAEGRGGIAVHAEERLDEFLSLNSMTFARKGQRRRYSDDHVRRLDAACAERECRRIFVARDQEGRIHAGAYLVWNADSAYYLMGGVDPKLRGSGAMSLCMWHAIRFAASVSKRFDFEGSMIEPIERFFRSFGAQQVPYFQVSRTTSRIMRVGQAIRSVFT
jgi:hypothetical protein